MKPWAQILIGVLIAVVMLALVYFLKKKASPPADQSGKASGQSQGEAVNLGKNTTLIIEPGTNSGKA